FRRRTWSGVAARTFHSGSRGSSPRGNGDSRLEGDVEGMSFWGLGKCPDSGSIDRNDTGLPIPDAVLRRRDRPSLNDKISYHGHGALGRIDEHRVPAPRKALEPDQMRRQGRGEIRLTLD